LHTGNLAIVELWLSNIERFLLDAQIAVLETPARRTVRRPTPTPLAVD
jgi:hypothetical protein